jgi:multiple sugar transport system substrate-binding protein
VFAEASAQVSPDFVWGPTMTQTYNDVSDGFKAAVTGKGTLVGALEKGEESTISAMEAQSIPVSK